MNTTFFLYKPYVVAFVIVVAFVVAPQARTQTQAQSREVIAEILVHGNFSTPSDEILAVAALRVGEPADEARLAEAEQRLRDSGRFESVEVRRRYRSIADPTQILVILLVDERVRGFGLWAPILSHRDGYGFTYGGRVSFDEPLGAGTRVSVPLTWGGERRAALEVERTFERGPLTSFQASASVFRVENPHYREIDSRRELAVRAERILTPWLRAGADARYSFVEFAGLESSYAAGGAQLTLDTRQDPTFPRNAVHAIVGIGRLPSTSLGPGKGASTAATDLRGYIGVGLRGIDSPLVLALRAQGSFASAALPRFEQPLVGGTDSLRGYRGGHQAGDSMSAISAELRLPITSPLTFARVGIRAFADAAAAWPHGESIRKQQFDRGIGAGIFFGATLLTGGVDVAWPEKGRPRVHASLGIAF